MPVEIRRPSSLDVSIKNPNNVIYVRGSDGSFEAWRIIVAGPIFASMSIQHFEPLFEAEITLDEAHVASIEGNSIFTSENPYYASVATDSRVDNTTPPGISGDMTGRVLEWDGFTWLSSDDQWFEKASFSESLFSDRGVFQRMNIIETDPNDPTRHPPQPTAGTTIGSRNTQTDGLGLELLSFNDKDGHFGQVIEMIHGGGDGLVNQAQCIKLDNTLVSIPYENAWVSGTTYAIGDIIIDAGIRFEANTAGIQTGLFASNISKWDAIDYGDIFDVDSVVTDGGAVVVNDGNVVVV